jgi:hypothetical protein
VSGWSSPRIRRRRSRMLQPARLGQGCSRLSGLGRRSCRHPMSSWPSNGPVIPSWRVTCSGVQGTSVCVLELLGTLQRERGRAPQSWSRRSGCIRVIVADEPHPPAFVQTQARRSTTSLISQMRWWRYARPTISCRTARCNRGRTSSRIRTRTAWMPCRLEPSLSVARRRPARRSPAATLAGCGLVSPGAWRPWLPTWLPGNSLAALIFDGPAGHRTDRRQGPEWVIH